MKHWEGKRITKVVSVMLAVIMLLTILPATGTKSFAAQDGDGSRANPYDGWTNHGFTFIEDIYDYPPQQIELRLTQIYTGAEANVIVKNENQYNQNPSATQSWILMEFNLKYVSGLEEETLDAYDVFYDCFYTASGAKISPASVAYFSGERSGKGVNDVSLYQGSESRVWVGILTDTSVGYPVLKLGEYYDIDDDYFGINNIWFSTKPAFNATEIRNFVVRLYEKVLFRTPSESEINYYKDLLVSGTSTGAELGKFFVLSTEFENRNMSNSDYVKILYQTFLNRECNNEEKEYWKSKLYKGESRASVLKGFVESNEYTAICNNAGITRGNLVLPQETQQVVITAPTLAQQENISNYIIRLYEKALGRAAEQEGKTYYLQEIISGNVTPTQAAKNFIFSPEFQNKNLSDTDYVKVLYRTFMGREFDTSGLAYHLNRLANGISREEILRGFAYSPEFDGIMESFGL